MVGEEPDGRVVEVPTLVPARMVNEFVYCPRFFHLAWSSGERGENDFTVEGKWVHRTVDQARGTLDPVSGTGRARSVTLSSERIGVVGRLDVVEVDDGYSVPVEIKRGRAHDPDHPVWEPERIQLAVHGLLLRDNGRRCDHGEVYFAESRERIRVDFDDALMEQVEELLEQLRAVASSPQPPEPLVDSPKCPACVMVAACLPDEHNLLRRRRGGHPRRLIPDEPAARPLYVTEVGARIGKSGDRIVVRGENKTLVEARRIDVSHVAIYGNVQISTAAIRALLAEEVPICWFSSGGWFFGIAEGLSERNVELRRRQVLVAEDVNVAIAGRMVEAKILNGRALVRRNGKGVEPDLVRELKRLALRAGRADRADQLLGIEGAAARLYFSAVPTMLKAVGAAWAFTFEHRNRRPPLDRVNCLLSFVYGLLVKDLTVAVRAIGMDPYLGVFHRPRFGRPALALDLAEEFRPLIADSVVVGMINNAEVKPGHFTTRGGGVGLTAEGRRKVLTAYERRLSTEFTHPQFKYRLTYRRAFDVQARLVGAVLLGEFDKYPSIVTR